METVRKGSALDAAARRRRAAYQFSALALGLASALGITPMAHADGLPVPLRDGATGALVRFDGARPPVTRMRPEGGRRMDIEQVADRAILHWESFDIARGNAVAFDQPRASSIALNRVLGAADAASLIDGALTANGRVFVINQNGIVFGPDARVSTRSLVASTLDIDDEIYRDIGFENAIREEDAAGVNRAAFSSGLADGERPGAVRVEEGARISVDRTGRVLLLAPSVSNSGTITAPEGQIILGASEDEVFLAPAPEEAGIRGLVVAVKTGGDVRNAGKLIAERGNVSLAGLAVNQDGLVRATTSISLDGSIRLVAQDMEGDATGKFAGEPATGFTPVPSRAGDLRLGPDSVTEILPDAGSERAPDLQRQPVSDVVLQGRRIVAREGARVFVPGGRVTAEAAEPGDASFAEPTPPRLTDPEDPGFEPIAIRLEPGATIDVSGDDNTRVSVARNFIEVEARGNELADAPLQRQGALRDKTLIVDVRDGAGFLNVDLENATERGVGERLSGGGELLLRSKGLIDVAEGALLDVSGGLVTFTPDTVLSSKLLTRDGRLVDIAEADPNLEYAGVFGDLEIEHPKWGVTETFRGPRLYEPGYVEGKDAGRLLVNAPVIRLHGEIIGRTTVGPFQRTKPADLPGQPFLRPHDEVPLGGWLDLRRLRLPAGDEAPNELILGTLPEEPEAAPGDEASLLLDVERLTSAGFSRVDIDNSGRITVAAPLELPAFGEVKLLGTQVDVASRIHAPGGQVVLEARRGGRSFDPDPDGSDFEPIGDLGGLRILTSESVGVTMEGSIDVGGTWTNDSAVVNAGIPAAPIVTSGGRIDVRSGRDVTLGPGARLDVGGGAHLDREGVLSRGRGGLIRLHSLTSEEPGILPRMRLEGELAGFGLGGGGELFLRAGGFRVSPVEDGAHGSLRLEGARLFSTAAGPGGAQSVLDMTDMAFGSGGFSSITLEAALSGIQVRAGARVALSAAGLRLDPESLLTEIPGRGLLAGGQSGAGGSLRELIPSGVPLERFNRIERRPEFAREPMHLTLRSLGSNGTVEISSGAAIDADPESRIRIDSAQDVFVGGSLSAPAGTVEVSLAGGGGGAGVNDQLRLGASASLSARGHVRLEPASVPGQRTGEVLDAGAVSLTANRGSLFAEGGAVIDVSAEESGLNLGPNGVRGATAVAGAAGEIRLRAAESLVFQGELRAAGALNRAGGRLSVTLDPNGRDAPGPNINLGVDQDPFYRGEFVARLADFRGELPAFGGELPDGMAGQAHVPLAALRRGGFDALAVTVRGPASAETAPDLASSRAVIAFDQELKLDLGREIRLDAAVLRATGPHAVRLSAPYVALGSSNRDYRFDGSIPLAQVTPQGEIDPADAPITLQPSPGAGLLRISSLPREETDLPRFEDEGVELVELVGELVLEGFGSAGQAGFPAPTPALELRAAGDIRVRGTRVQGENVFSGLLRAAGEVSLHASRVFPTTLTGFELAVSGPDGRVEVRSPGAPETAYPLSIGGAIDLEAASILQAGNLYAPLGRLSLDASRSLVLAAGSRTSTSAHGVRAPFFETQPGGDVVFPRGEGEGGGFDDIVFASSPDEPFEQPLPSQALVLESPRIDFQAGAAIDMRGGGDVRSREFVPGPGGSRDILEARLQDESGGTRPNPSFAVLAGVTEFAPYDPQLTRAAAGVQDLRPGDTVVLEEGAPGLPAGEYAMLPPAYALHGGFLLTPAEGTRDLLPGADLTRADGAPIVAGRFGVGGSTAMASRSRGFAVESGVRVRTRAEYREAPLSRAYEGTARRPEDAGLLTVAAGDALRLEGRLVPGGAPMGRGAEVDILGDALRVVTEPQGDPGIELMAADLEALGAASILIGGRRVGSAEGITIEPAASTIEVQRGVDLELDELLLVGGEINLGGEGPGGVDTTLASTGARQAAPRPLIIGTEGEGSMVNAAVVGVSRSALILERLDGAGKPPGRLTVSAGVALEARGTVLADAVGTVDFQGGIGAPGGLVSLGGSGVRIGGGEAGAGTADLVLSNAKLAELAGSDLRLRSDNVVEIRGDLLDPDTGEPLAFGSLELDAQGLVGADPEGSGESTPVRLLADSIRIRNRSRSSISDGRPATGRGLRMESSELILGGTGGQSFRVSGYREVRAEARSVTRIEGENRLLVDAPFELTSPMILGTTGASAVVDAGESGLDLRTGGDAPSGPGEPGLGVTLDLRGATVSYGGHAVLPSGRMRIVADDDLTMLENAVADLAGRGFDYGPARAETSGGVVSLLSRTGGIRIGAGALLDLGPGGDEAVAGRLTMEAPQGHVEIAGEAHIAGGGRRHAGAFSLDARSLEVGDTTGMSAYTELSRLLDDGFSEARMVRLRGGQGLQLDAGEVAHATELRLVSDQGSIRIEGTLSASAPQSGGGSVNGGRVVLAAGDRIELVGHAGPVIEARGTLGGTVELVTLDADGSDGHVAGTGTDTLEDVVRFVATPLEDAQGHVIGQLPPRIDVSGTQELPAFEDALVVPAGLELGGSVRIHTRWVDSSPAGVGDGILDAPAVGSMGLEVDGARELELVATRIVDVGDGEISLADIDGWRGEIETALEETVDEIGGFAVVPGLVVQHPGGMDLKAEWNLQDSWHFEDDDGNPVAGHLTLRAGGDLELEHALSDGFFDKSFFFGTITLRDRLVRGAEAWGLRLVGGADLASADLTALGGQAGGVKLGAGAMVRTGTGDIEVVARDDVALGAGAAVYTAGYDRGLSENVVDVYPGDFLVPTELRFNEWMGDGAMFPVQGGDVTLRAGGRVYSDAGPASPTEWQPRIGEATQEGNPTELGRQLAKEEGAVPTHWGIAFERFVNGVGALGGGTLRIEAGGDVERLTIAVPTTGRAIAGAVRDPDSSASEPRFAEALETTEVAGGGALRVHTEGALRDSVLYLGRGAAHVSAAGSVGDAQTPLEVYMGFDGDVRLEALGEAHVGRVSDFSAVGLSASQTRRLANQTTSYLDNSFFSYEEGASVRLASVAGDLSLSGSLAGRSALPPQFRAASISRNLELAGDIVQYPAPGGGLSLLAGENISMDTTGQGTPSELVQSDQDAALLPDIQEPDENRLFGDIPVHADVPVRIDDSEPNVLVAGEGSIEALGRQYWDLELAKGTHMEAGKDIVNVSVKVQNLRQTDITSFIAGRDILQRTQRNDDGSFQVPRESERLANDVVQFEVAGPGVAEFLAGRRIDLGTSDGIETIGNTNNRFLPEAGADLLVVAGLGEGLDYDGAIDAFLRQPPAEGAGTGDYSDALAHFLDERGHAIGEAAPVDAFAALPRKEQRLLLKDILFNELKESGTFAQSTGTNDFSRGFRAIEELFMGPDPDGGVSLLLSQIQTIRGGDLSLVVPGGDINAGAASADIIEKGVEELGIVAAQDGDVDIFVDGDLIVNATRVFALQGDLLVWSSNGSINAGRGAKTVASVPAPIARIGPTGDTVIFFPPAFEGSGLLGVDVNLFAPRGVVDAGDAGIRATGDLTIGATEVLGADNIDFGGISVGVPTGTVTPPPVAPAQANVATQATRDVTEQASAGGGDSAGPARNEPLAIITVDVLGFGGG